MKKWASGLDAQRKVNIPAAAISPAQSTPDFAWMQNVNSIENPYKEDDEEEDEQALQAMGGTISRTATSASRDNLPLASLSRQPPPQFPLPAPPRQLSVQTQGGAQSPGPRGMDSYFSPTADSPASSRTSVASTLLNQQYPFPRTGTPQSGWEDKDYQRYTAPAMPRAPSRDGPSPSNSRNPRGPSMPVMASQQSLAQQQRSRSYSTPNIEGQQNARRTNSTTPVPAVPGIPPHLHHPAHDLNIPRSQTGSPRQDYPIRTNTQSPGSQRERSNQSNSQYGGTMAQFPAQPIYSRQGTPSAIPQPLTLDGRQASVSPALGSATQGSNSDMPIPTQLKVKVNCDTGTYVTLVVPFNITYQSLIDRIDVKLARFTNSSIGKGNLRLRYRDEDSDLVTIESDDDIQVAFLEWREGARNMYTNGVGEIELFCVGDTS